MQKRLNNINALLEDIKMYAKTSSYDQNQIHRDGNLEAEQDQRSHRHDFCLCSHTGMGSQGPHFCASVRFYVLKLLGRTKGPIRIYVCYLTLQVKGA